MGWETYTEALVYITRYRIEHPTQADGKFTVKHKSRGPIDRLIDRWHHVGEARDLETAKHLAVKHEAAHRKED